MTWAPTRRPGYTRKYCTKGWMTVYDLAILAGRDRSQVYRLIRKKRWVMAARQFGWIGTAGPTEKRMIRRWCEVPASTVAAVIQHYLEMDWTRLRKSGGMETTLPPLSQLLDLPALYPPRDAND